ncbi:TPA: hypothetical protein ACF39K_004478 [Vibrio parahaemolyticus]|uniref:hypothetical protein n=1 Tax=Vibrio parahaemolyticus TaxID=670 RepID=UPI00046E9046|nr:hypothetical protein [Vibrio parahaemolyticus]MBO0159900.1 hypothetical protein [Vibrio parahaemolyticus]MBO0175110.1 hypothetical protein [Vibrio parahaemolyticus]MCX8859931.1 hypothetical protein [Vibrio parahaemolyticus]MCX8865107.1 hypothetical protein [Vibrio parahaemolyticus]MCX8870232.1 hypothetical protein [Vibrio parahaemolyticus]
MDKYSLVISSISLVVSIFVLFISYRSGKTAIRSFLINRDVYRSSAIDFEFVCSKQHEGYYILKFVVFNPSPTKAIIKSFSVYSDSFQRNRILRFLGVKKWRRIEESRWCPTAEDVCEEIGVMESHYKDLLVVDCKNIMVSMPGWIPRNEFMFRVKTNVGCMEIVRSVDATEIYFPYNFERWYNE